LSYHRTHESATTSGPATVTVCTNHVALRHLVEDALPVPISQALGDPKLLVGEVVELEYERVTLSTVDAGMCAEELDEERRSFACRRPLALLSQVDVAAAVR
jgi:hypothetical protein